MPLHLHNVLEGKWIDPDTGMPVQFPHVHIAWGAGAMNRLPEYILAGMPARRVLLVQDSATMHAAGEQAAALLRKKCTLETLTFPSPLVATDVRVEEIMVKGRESDVLVAVGSGTLNDLCKLASYRLAKPYGVIATAPSMNGYLSANASVTVGKHKQSLPAHMPQWVIVDSVILSAAPLRLIRSGLGDMLCRPTAQADWLLSHFLTGSSYKKAPFALLAPVEEALYAAAGALGQRDVRAIELLMEALLLSGIGMCLAGGSYPASQGEHMIAHTMEMVYGDTLPLTYHGEAIGVTTLTMAAWQASILQGGAVEVQWDRYPAHRDDFFPAAIKAECKAAVEKKRSVLKEGEVPRELWYAMRDAIMAVTISRQRLQEVLAAAGAPVTPEALGWPREAYQKAVGHARYSRERVTFLDLRGGSTEFQAGAEDSVQEQY